MVLSSANAAPTNESIFGFMHLEAADVPYEASTEAPGLGVAVLSDDPDEAGI